MRAVRSFTTVVLAATAVMSAACAANPADISVPRGVLHSTYPITIEFADVLNLPDGAKVAFDGASVGAVHDINLSSGIVAVDIDVDAEARIPATSTAAITQDTILGDPYIKLDRPAEPAGAAMLEPHSRITVQQTTTPPAPEDTLAVLANFLGTGSLQRVQQSITDLNAAMPTSAEQMRRLAGTLAVDLRDLASHTGEIDRTLAALIAGAHTMNVRSDELVRTFAPETMKFWSNFKLLSANIGVLLPSVGSVYSGGYWLVPMLDALGDVTDQVPRTAGDAVSVDRFVRTTLLPFLRAPKVDVTSVVTGGTENVAGITDVLRMLGATR